MRRFLTILLLAAAAFAQNTAKFPTSLVTLQDLSVAKDAPNRSVLVGAIDNVTATAVVADGSVFRQYGIVMFADTGEQAMICSISTNTLTFCGRHFAGTSAAAHGNGIGVLGNITAWPQNQIVAELIAMQNFLGVNGANVTVSWASLSGKPTAISTWTNDVGYLTAVPAQTWTSITGKPTAVSAWTNDSGYLTSASSLAWAKLTDVPSTFAPSAHASSHAGAGSDPITSLGAMTFTGNVSFNNALLVNGATTVGAAPFVLKQVTGNEGAVVTDSASSNPKQLFMGFNTTLSYAHIWAIQQGVGYMNLALAESGGNVGIGTTTPVSQLTINTSSFTGAAGIAAATVIDDKNNGRFSVESITPVFQVGAFHGTQSARTATLSGDILGFFQAGGHDGTNQNFNRARMVMYAGENYTPTTQGTGIAFQTTAVGGVAAPAERMRIDPSGNVGIGVTPFTVLHVSPVTGAPAASGNLNTGVVISQGTMGPSLNLGNYNSGSVYYSWIQSAFVNNAGTVEPLALNPIGGYVGIGKTNPGSALDVNGNITAGSGTNTLPSAAASAATFWLKGTHDYRVSMNDGTGNVNQYLNSYYDSGVAQHRCIVAGNPPARITMTAGTITLNASATPCTNAGDYITWNTALSTDSAGNVTFPKNVTVTGTLTGTATYATTAGTANAVAWTNVSGRFTDLNQFANASGFQTGSGTVANAGNATTAGGLAVGTVANTGVNQIVRTDSNGYIEAGWINTASGDNGTTAISRVYASSDAYLRYYSMANFAKQAVNAYTHEASFVWQDNYIALPTSTVVYGVFAAEASQNTITKVQCWSDTGDAVLQLRRNDGGDMISGNVACNGSASTSFNGYQVIPAGMFVGMWEVSGSAKRINVAITYTTSY